MYRREFEQLLKSGFPKAVMLYGENTFMLEYYADIYKKELDASETVLTMYHDEYNFERAREYLSQSSLFGGNNLLIIRRDGKIPKKELDTLVELGSKNSDSYFVLLFTGNNKAAREMQRSFGEKQGGVWVRFFESNPRESAEILQTKANSLGLEIDQYALNHLIAMLNGNLSLCMNELEKLAILDKKIESSDIDRLVYSAAPLAVEKLLIDLFMKKPVTETIEKLLELGEDEFGILRAAQIFINQIFLFHAYIKMHGQPDSKAILGYKLPRHVEEQKAALALRIRSSSLLKIYEHLLESELRLKKSGSSSREVLLYGVLIKLQNFL